MTDLVNLNQNIQNHIINKIEWLLYNFEQIQPQPLTRNLTGFYKLRVGDYRVIYEFYQSLKIIIIVQIGHRREIYD